MAERLAYLEAVVGADVTSFRRGMGEVRNEVSSLSGAIGGLQTIGRNLTFAFTAPLALLGTAAISAASDFDASMRNINAIANLTSGELEDLSRRAVEFGAATRSGAQAAGDALYTVFSAGLTDVEDAFSAMEVAVYTAEAGLADLEVTTESLLSVMLSYGDTSEEMAWRASNAITQMVAVGVGSMEEFAGALGNVVPTATAIGMSIEDLMGDMAFLTQRGLSAAKASTALNSALTALIKPSDAMAEAIHALGATSAQELIENFGGVNEALAALIGYADGSQEALAAMFGNIRGLRAINLFAGDLEGWNAAMEEFNASLDGATLRAWESQMDSFSASWDSLVSAAQGAAIVIGSAVLPILKPLVDFLRDLVLTIMDVNPEFIKWGIILTTVAGAIPPLIWLFTSLLSPIGLVLGAVVALGTAFTTNFMGIKDTVSDAISSIIGILAPAADAFTEFWGAIFPEELEATPPEITGTIPDPKEDVRLGGDTSKSLWDIYEDEGYIESMSWNEFMDLATEGGWEGGAIEPDSPITLSLPKEADTDVDALIPMGEMRAEADMAGQVVPQTFADRFVQAWGTLYPRISAEATAIFNQAVNWFDGFGANILNSIIQVIDDINPDDIYQGIVTIFDDGWSFITGAISSGGTEASGAVGAFFEGVQSQLPQFTARFGELISSIGHWIVNNGIPLLAQSVAYIGTQLGFLISDAVSGAVAWLTGGGGGDIDFLGYIQTNIIDPFVQGFTDAVEGTEFGGWLETAETAITDFLDAVSLLVSDLYTYFNVADIIANLKSMVDWFGKLLTKITEGDWAGAGAMITSAFDGLWTTVSTYLNEFWTSAILWFVTRSTSVLDAVTSWFTGADATEMYTNFKTFISDGFDKITELFSGFGGDAQSGVEEWGTDIEGALPKITESLGNLMTAVGDWLLSDGVQMLSYSLGYAAGIIGAAITAAIAGAISMAFGMSDDASSGFDAGEDVVQPFQEGFNAALGDVGVEEGSLESIVITIVTALTALMTVSRFLPVGNALMFALSGAMRIATFVGGGLLTAAGTMMTAIKTFLIAKVATIGGWSAVVSAIGTAISTATAGIGAATSWVVTAVTPILTAIGSALVASPLILAGLGISLGVGTYLLIPEETKTAIRDAIGNFFDWVFGEGAWDAMMKGLNDALIGVADGITSLITGDAVIETDAEIKADFENAGYDFTAIREDILTRVDREPPIETSVPISINEVSMPPIDPSNLAVGDDPVVVDSITIDPDTAVITTSDSGIVLDDTTGDTIVPLTPEVDLSGLGTGFSEEIAAGMDTETIILEQLLPLNEAWVGMFGEEGTMTMAFGSFVEGQVLGFTKMNEATNAWILNLTTQLPAASGALDTIASGIVGSLVNIQRGFQKATEDLKDFNAALKALTDVATSVTVNVDVTGSGTDGSHAKGLPEVPFDGYIAELHKGERVLTAAESDEYANMMLSKSATKNIAMQPAQGGGDTTTTYNTISVSGVRDVDTFVREMERRGIVLK
jgi:TP901 family phage tail tape measure protein